MSQLSHYRYIDALRGIAFLCVLTCHVSLQTPSLPLYDVAQSGRYGVQLFYLLSAVTLLRSLHVRGSKERFPTRNFFVRRLFRIGPLFWLVMILYIPLQGLGPQYWAPTGIGFWQFFSTALFIHGWTPTTINSVVPGGWSIAVEMTFYLCLPFLARRLTTAWSAAAAGIYSFAAAMVLNWLVSAVLMGGSPPDEQRLVPYFIYFWFPSQFPVFMLGFVTYYCLNSGQVMDFISVRGRPALLVFGVICGCLGLSPVPGKDWLLVPYYIYFSAAFIFVILALKARPLALLVNPVTCGLGVISYSCYLLHPAAVEFAGAVVRPSYFMTYPPDMAVYFRYVVIWFAGLGLTVVAATLTYFLVEKPGIKLGSLIIGIWEREKRASDTTTDVKSEARPLKQAGKGSPIAARKKAA